MWFSFKYPNISLSFALQAQWEGALRSIGGPSVPVSQVCNSAFCGCVTEQSFLYQQTVHV